MTYVTFRAHRFPMEGYQLVFYMKHIKTNAHRKGSDVAKEYDGQFRIQRLNVRIAVLIRISLYPTWFSHLSPRFSSKKDPREFRRIRDLSFLTENFSIPTLLHNSQLFLSKCLIFVFVLCWSWDKGVSWLTQTYWMLSESFAIPPLTIA